MSWFINILRGVAIGVANIIPGVSGGTMALLLGIYERLITAVHNVGPRTLTAIFRGKRAFIYEMRRVDALFLTTIAVGALAAVVAIAKVMVVALDRYHDPTYGFFFGLVLLSVVVPYRMIRKKTAATWIAGLLAIVAVVGLTLAMSGEQRVASARKKAAIKAAKVRAKHVSAEQRRDLTPRVSQQPAQLALFFGAGAIAISAMILPGISGSFILLLMGVYFDVLMAVNARQLPVLGVFAAGCLLGLLVFTRLINYMLERYHDVTVGFLAGLVVGSLYAIWPFKSFEVVAGQRVDMDNVLPASFGENELVTLAAVGAGVAVVAAFIWLESKQQRDRAEATNTPAAEM